MSPKRRKNDRREKTYPKHELLIGIDIGEKESVATYLSPTGDIIEHFKFAMNESGYNAFSKKVPINARGVFEASGLAYVVLKTITINRIISL